MVPPFSLLIEVWLGLSQMHRLASNKKHSNHLAGAAPPPRCANDDWDAVEDSHLANVGYRFQPKRLRIDHENQTQEETPATAQSKEADNEADDDEGGQKAANEWAEKN